MQVSTRWSLSIILIGLPIDAFYDQIVIFHQWRLVPGLMTASDGQK